MAFNINAQVILSGPKNLNKITRDIKKQLNLSGSTITLKVDKSTAGTLKAISSGVNGLNKSIQSLNTSADRTVKALSRLSAISATGATSTINLANQNNRLAKSNYTVARSASDAAKGLDAFGRQAAASLRAATAFAFTTRAIFGLNNAIQNGIKDAVAYEKSLIGIAQATNSSVKDLDVLKNKVNELSVSLGINANEVLETARVLAQAGLSAEDTASALEALTKSTLSGTFGDISNTTEGLIAALSQFGIAASKSEVVLASLNEVSKRFAVESEDLIAAIQRAGGVFSVAANDAKDPIEALQQFAAIITSVRSTTRESAETIATGLRTIFTRIQRKSTIEFLQNLGIELVNAEGQFVGLYEAFRRLSAGLDDIIAKGDAVALSGIVEELGGVRQAGKLIPAIKEFARAEAALKAAQEGAAKGLTGDVDKALQGLGVRFAQTQAKFQGFIRSIVESDTFQKISRFVLDTADAFIDLADSLKPLLPLIATLGASFLAKGAVQFAGGFFSGLGGGGVRDIGSTIGGTITGRGAGSSSSAATAASMKQIVDSNNKLITILNQTSTNIVNLTNSINKLVTAITNNTIALGRKPQIMGSITRRSSGGKIYGFARGGLVPGEGNTDSVPAMLSPGEFVIRKSSVGKIGTDTLAAMNENRFQEGGEQKLNIASIRQELAGQRSKRTKLTIDKDNKLVNKGIGILKLGEEKADLNSYAGAFLRPEGSGKTFSGTNESIFSEVKKTASYKALEEFTKGSSPGSTTSQLKQKADELIKKYQQKNKYNLLAGGLELPVSNQLEDELLSGVINTIKSGVNVLEQELGITGNLDTAKALKQANIDQTMGNLFESVLNFGGSPYENTRDTPNAPFDFKKGLGKVATKFGIPSNIPTDAKTTLSDDSLKSLTNKVRNQNLLEAEYELAEPLTMLVDFLKNQDRPAAFVKKAESAIKQKKASGGSISGQDTVPALLTPGEFVLNRESSRSIGYGNLNRMNKQGIAGFNKGGLVGVQNFAVGGRVSVGKDQAQNRRNVFDELLRLSKTADDATYRLEQYNLAIKQGKTQVEAINTAFKGLATVQQSKKVNESLKEQEKAIDKNTETLDTFSKLQAFEGIASAVTSATVAIQAFDLKNPLASILSLGFAAAQAAQALKVLTTIDLIGDFKGMLGSVAMSGPKNPIEGFFGGADLEVKNLKKTFSEIGETFKSFNVKNIKGSFANIFKSAGKIFKGADLTPNIARGDLEKLLGKGFKIGKGESFNANKILTDLQKIRGGVNPKSSELLKKLDDAIGGVTKSTKAFSGSLKLGSLAVKGLSGGILGFIASLAIDPIINAITDKVLGKKQKIGSFGFEGREGVSTGGAAAAGAIGGGISGAVTGAAIGAFIPIIGPIAGAAVGAIVGSITGGLSAAIEQAAFNALKALQKSSKSAAEALDRFNQKTNINASDVGVVNKKLTDVFQDIQKSIPAAVTASKGLIGGFFTSIFSDVFGFGGPILGPLLGLIPPIDAFNQFNRSFFNLDRAFIEGDASVKAYAATLEQIGPELIDKANQALSKGITQFVNEINTAPLAEQNKQILDQFRNLETLNVEGTNVEGVARSFSNLNNILKEAADKGNLFAEQLKNQIAFTVKLNVLDDFNKQLQIIATTDPRAAGKYAKLFEDVNKAAGESGDLDAYIDAIDASTEGTSRQKEELKKIVTARFNEINAQIKTQQAIADMNRLLAEARRSFDAFSAGIQRFTNIATGSIQQYGMAVDNIGNEINRVFSDTQAVLDTTKFNPFENLEAASNEQLTGAINSLRNFVPGMDPGTLETAFGGTQDFITLIRDFPKFLKEGLTKSIAEGGIGDQALNPLEAFEAIQNMFAKQELQLPDTALAGLRKELAAMATESGTISAAALVEALTSGNINKLLGESADVLRQGFSEAYNSLLEFDKSLAQVSNLQLEVARNERKFRIESVNRARRSELEIARLRGRTINETGFARGTVNQRLTATAGTSNTDELLRRREAALNKRQRLEEEGNKLRNEGIGASSDALKKNSEQLRDVNNEIESTTEALKDFGNQTEILTAIQADLAASRARERQTTSGLVDIISLATREAAGENVTEEFNKLLAPIAALQRFTTGQPLDATREALPLLDALVSGNNAAFEGALQVFAKESGLVDAEGNVDQAKLEEQRLAIEDKMIDGFINQVAASDPGRARQLEPLLRGMQETRKRERAAQDSLINLAEDIAKEQEKILGRLFEQDQAQIAAILEKANAAFDQAVKGFQQAVNDLAMLRETAAKEAATAKDEAIKNEENRKKAANEGAGATNPVTTDNINRPSTEAAGIIGGMISTGIDAPINFMFGEPPAAPPVKPESLPPGLDVIPAGAGSDTLTFDPTVSDNITNGNSDIISVLGEHTKFLSKINEFAIAALTPGSIYCNVHGTVLDNILEAIKNCCALKATSDTTTPSTNLKTIFNNVLSPIKDTIANLFKIDTKTITDAVVRTTATPVAMRPAGTETITKVTPESRLGPVRPEVVKAQPFGSVLAQMRMRNPSMGVANANIGRVTTEQRLQQEIAMLQERLSQTPQIDEKRATYREAIKSRRSQLYKIETRDQSQIEKALGLKGLIPTENIDQLMKFSDQVANTFAAIPEAIQVETRIEGSVNVLGGNDLGNIIAKRVIDVLMPLLPKNSTQPVIEGQLAGNQNQQ